MWKSSPIKSNNDIKRGIILPNNKKMNQQYMNENMNINTNSTTKPINTTNRKHVSSHSNNPNTNSNANHHLPCPLHSPSDPIDSIYTRILESSSDMFSNTDIDTDIDMNTNTDTNIDTDIDMNTNTDTNIDTVTTTIIEESLPNTNKTNPIDTTDTNANPIDRPVSYSMFDDDNDHINRNNNSTSSSNINVDTNMNTNTNTTTSTTTNTNLVDNNHRKNLTNLHPNENDVGSGFDVDPITAELLQYSQYMLAINNTKPNTTNSHPNTATATDTDTDSNTDSNPNPHPNQDPDPDLVDKSLAVLLNMQDLPLDSVMTHVLNRVCMYIVVYIYCV